ncbi:hypothetical protein ACIQRE_01855 [Streptomyces griseoluteus]|uniref:hypothetical protein n=1 Tax=Streptomyces griseoluteus TaxID=29306 RepID=UPI0037F4EFF4
MSDEISEPITELAAQAAAHHEVFQSWVEAGFTEAQALELLKTLLAGAVGGAA